MTSPDNEVLKTARRMIAEFGPSAQKRAEEYGAQASGEGQYEAAAVWQLVRDRIAILQRHDRLSV